MRPALAGRRIVVTRARHQASKLSDALRDLGAEVIELPVIEIVPLASYVALDEALQNIDRYKWMIFTSANAVRVARERLDAVGRDPASLAGTQVIAIGPATATALKSHGLPVDMVPENYVAEALVSAFSDSVAGTKILLIRAKIARDIIPDALRNRGAIVDVIDAYETLMPADSLARLPAVLASAPDAVTFTSSSTVTNFIALLRQCEVDFPPPIRAISIGPVTSRTLRDSGWEPFAEATEFDVQGLIEAIARALSKSRICD